MLYTNITENFFKTPNAKSVPLVVSSTLKTVLAKANSNNRFIKRLLVNVPTKAAYLPEDHPNFFDIDVDENGVTLLSYTTSQLVQKSIKLGRIRNVLSEEEVFGQRATHLIREKTRPGRLVPKLFDKYTNAELEEFSTVISSINISEAMLSSFQEVTGDMIKYYYGINSYAENPGEGSTLHNSCMRYPNINMYMDMYAENPNQISLLVLKNVNAKIKGRAIVWTIGSTKYIDRIYYDSFSTYSLFLKYCNVKGIINITSKNANFNSDIKDQPFTIKLDKWLFTHYPYPDSLVWLDIQNGTLSNVKTSVGKAGIDSTVLKNLLPAETDNTVIDNTIELLETLRRDYDSSLCLVDQPVTLFNIQSTNGKGNSFTKLKRTKDELILLDGIYSAYCLQRYTTKAVNLKGLSFRIDCTEYDTLDSKGQFKEYSTVYYNQKFTDDSYSSVRRVLTPNGEANYAYAIEKVLVKGSSSRCGSLAAKEDTVQCSFLTPFNFYLHKAKAALLIPTMPDSYVPLSVVESGASELFRLKFKHLAGLNTDKQKLEVPEFEHLDLLMKLIVGKETWTKHFSDKLCLARFEKKYRAQTVSRTEKGMPYEKIFITALNLRKREARYLDDSRRLDLENTCTALNLLYVSEKNFIALSILDTTLYIPDFMLYSETKALPEHA